ncbi:hypothetical protein SEA_PHILLYPHILLY_110 [Microbacterium phage PhillyPhilly]|nr:hypothetical protein SEA_PHILLYPHILLY_110 [Microbacterium phage PhillyPhilly]
MCGTVIEQISMIACIETGIRPEGARMSTIDYLSHRPLPVPPPGRKLNSYMHIDWIGVYRKITEEQDKTVLGWVRIQRAMKPEARLRPGEIAKRMDVSSDLLDVRYEPSLRGSESWNEHKVNEISSNRVRQKIRARKRELAEMWGWDTWIRWTPPEQLTDEQVAVIARVEERRAKNAKAAIDDYEQYVKPREEIGEKLRAMDSWAREIYHLEDGVEHLPPHLRERDERRATLLKRTRLIAHRKNQRMGQEGWREWRISITREMAERGKR